jgi:preprotein translocase subunit Sec63
MVRAFILFLYFNNFCAEIVEHVKHYYNGYVSCWNEQASKDEINNAFRKMSRIYHPDKHTSEDTKIKAEVLFNKIKKAHEGLFVFQPSLKSIVSSNFYVLINMHW